MPASILRRVIQQSYDATDIISIVHLWCLPHQTNTLKSNHRQFCVVTYFLNNDIVTLAQSHSPILWCHKHHTYLSSYDGYRIILTPFTLTLNNIIVTFAQSHSPIVWCHRHHKCQQLQYNVWCRRHHTPACSIQMHSCHDACLGQCCIFYGSVMARPPQSISPVPILLSS